MPREFFLLGGGVRGGGGESLTPEEILGLEEDLYLLDPGIAGSLRW